MTGGVVGLLREYWSIGDSNSRGWTWGGQRGRREFGNLARVKEEDKSDGKEYDGIQNR